MLVIHGAKDLPRRRDRRLRARSPRCSAGASLSKLLYFPDENHWVPEAAEQHPLARHRARLAGPLDEVTGPP